MTYGLGEKILNSIKSVGNKKSHSLNRNIVIALCSSRNRSKRKALGILFAIILPRSLLQKAFSEIGTLLCLFLSFYEFC
jgi:hypothetical protein